MGFEPLLGAGHSVRPYRGIKLDHDLFLFFSSAYLGDIVSSCKKDNTTEAGILPDGGSPVRLMKVGEGLQLGLGMHSQAKDAERAVRWR